MGKNTQIRVRAILLALEIIMIEKMNYQLHVIRTLLAITQKEIKNDELLTMFRRKFLGSKSPSCLFYN